MNIAVIIGNLGREPELRKTGSGRPVTNFNVAVDRKYYVGEGEDRQLHRETDWIPVVVWNTQAEVCSKFLQKGSKVSVEGSIRPREYDDRNGVHHKTFELVASRVEFLDKIRSVEDTSNTDIPEEDVPSMEDAIPED